MSKYHRLFVPGGTYFFTVVTHNRRPLLTTEIARELLREAIHRERKERPFTIHAIVLLPDHLHTVWELPSGDFNYSLRWRRIKTDFTRAWIQQTRWTPPTTASQDKREERSLWQRRFYEHTCRDEDDFKRCIDYVHVNPLKHGLVERVADWKWSSFHRFVKLGEYSPNLGSANIWFGDEFRHAE